MNQANWFKCVRERKKHCIFFILFMLEITLLGGLCSIYHPWWFLVSFYFIVLYRYLPLFCHIYPNFAPLCRLVEAHIPLVSRASLLWRRTRWSLSLIICHYFIVFYCYLPLICVASSFEQWFIFSCGMHPLFLLCLIIHFVPEFKAG